MIKNNMRSCALVLCAVMSLSAASCARDSDTSQEQTVTTTIAQTSVSAVPAAAEMSETTTTAPPETTTAETTTKKKVKETKKENFDPLTGLYDVSDSSKGKRPCAVMVNNIEASLPQYGIYDAGILFEIPVEGGITRLMPIYADESKIPNVCSVRSARYYFALFAQSFDAVFLHWGIDKKVAEPMLNDLGIDRIDGYYNTNIYARDSARAQYFDEEHTGYLYGKGVMNEIERLGLRSGVRDGFDSFFSFYDKLTKPAGDDCTAAVVRFSDYYISRFDYSGKTHTYKKLHNGSKHMDNAVNKQLEYTNLLILETKEIKIINQNNGLISVDWSGGDGYLVTAGKVKKISWSKKDEFAKLELSDENGGTVKLNTGKTYIALAPRGAASFG